jgi:hypothetical protein
MFRSIWILGEIWALFGGTILGGYPHGAPCHRPHKLGHPNDDALWVCVAFLGMIPLSPKHPFGQPNCLYKFGTGNLLHGFEASKWLLLPSPLNEWMSTVYVYMYSRMKPPPRPTRLLLVNNERTQHRMLQVQCFTTKGTSTTGPLFSFWCWAARWMSRTKTVW